MKVIKRWRYARRGTECDKALFKYTSTMLLPIDDPRRRRAKVAYEAAWGAMADAWDELNELGKYQKKATQ